MIRLFWRYFFDLLLVVIALAEWTCVAWLMRHLGGISIAPFFDIAVPLGIYVLNRVILARPAGPGRLHRVFRVAYTRVAFTSIFGMAFLVLIGATWTVAWASLHVAGFGNSTDLLGVLSRTTQAFASGGLLLVGGAMAYAYAVGATRLWLNEMEVPIAHLPVDLDGLRIVQISDIHAGPFMSPEKLAPYVKRVNELRPDLIVITGDLTDTAEHAAEAFPILARLRARLGVYAILGNHDVAAGADAVANALTLHTDIVLLRDDVVEVRDGSGSLYVIGLADRGLDWARGVRFCRVLESLGERVPDGQPLIVLSHRPDLFEQARDIGASLVLSGHTHGGQLAVPYSSRHVASLAHFMTPYPRGTYRNGGCTLHVNLGLGMTGQPVRLATPREITVICLRARD